MAYNNNFPVNYQPAMYYPGAYPAQGNNGNQQTQNNPIIWVSGEAGAKAYLVAPNTTVQLWDSEAQTIYLKSADTSGMPTMKILDYVIREQSVSQVAAPALMQDAVPDYITRDDLAEFEERLKKQFVIRKKREGENE